jgi:hypothetical protein
MIAKLLISWVVLIFGGLVILCGAGCTSGTPNTLPLPQDLSTHTVIVSIDTWHAMLAFPFPTSDESSQEAPEFEEWGYAERAWYVKGQTGITGIFRALFWPSDGVVEVGRHPAIWAERTPQPPVRIFLFHLEEDQYDAIRRHLQATMASSTPIAEFGPSRFFPAVRSYHVFHTCHQYAAQALRAGGLPLTPSLAFTSSMLARQLESLQRKQQPKNE